MSTTEVTPWGVQWDKENPSYSVVTFNGQPVGMIQEMSISLSVYQTEHGNVNIPLLKLEILVPGLEITAKDPQPPVVSVGIDDIEIK